MVVLPGAVNPARSRVHKVVGFSFVEPDFSSATPKGSPLGQALCLSLKSDHQGTTATCYVLRRRISCLFAGTSHSHHDAAKQAAYHRRPSDPKGHLGQHADL